MRHPWCWHPHGAARRLADSGITRNVSGELRACCWLLCYRPIMSRHYCWQPQLWAGMTQLTPLPDPNSPTLLSPFLWLLADNNLSSAWRAGSQTHTVILLNWNNIDFPISVMHWQTFSAVMTNLFNLPAMHLKVLGNCIVCRNSLDGFPLSEHTLRGLLITSNPLSSLYSGNSPWWCCCRWARPRPGGESGWPHSWRHWLGSPGTRGPGQGRATPGPWSPRGPPPSCLSSPRDPGERRELQ